MVNNNSIYRLKKPVSLGTKWPLMKGEHSPI